MSLNVLGEHKEYLIDINNNLYIVRICLKD